MKPKFAAILYLCAVCAGFLFSSVSTFDFVQHLDRELHGIHCSFIPGLGSLDAGGSSGCSLALMSPYSSVLRKSIWGGIPISLGGMAVFAFLVFRGIALFPGRRFTAGDRWKTLFIVSLLPVLTSVVMGGIAIAELGAFCKLCVGIYMSSAAALLFAGLGWRLAVRPAGYRRYADDSYDDSYDDSVSDFDSLDDETAETEVWAQGSKGSGKLLVMAALQLAVFVALPIAAYAMLAPDSSRYVGSCGELTKPDDPYGVMVPLDGSNEAGRIPVIEVLDPLCPACRGFERRFAASDLGEDVYRRALLFPLDNTCNWMVSEAIHPGACTISEAILCADGQAKEVVEWAFAEQEAIRSAAADDPKAAAKMVTAAFPQLKGCVGSPKVRTRVNRSLRWTVANQLPVMLPQVFVGGVKLCDADTDLGLEYALSRLLDRHRSGVGPLTPEDDKNSPKESGASQ